MRDTGRQARGLWPEDQVGYSFMIQGTWGRGKVHLPHSSGRRQSQAYITSSFFVLGKNILDLVRCNEDGRGAGSNQQRGGNLC